MKRRFSVRLIGGFYTFELDDDKGREVFEIEEACLSAEEQFPGEWAELWDGDKGISRDNYIESLQKEADA